MTIVDFFVDAATTTKEAIALITTNDILLIVHYSFAISTRQQTASYREKPVTYVGFGQKRLSFWRVQTGTTQNVSLSSSYYFIISSRVIGVVFSLGLLLLLR